MEPQRKQEVGVERTDRCLWLLRGRTRGGCKYKEVDSGSAQKKNFQVICTTQYGVSCQTVQSSHTQGGWGYRTPVVAPGVLFMAFYSGNRRNPPAEQLQTEKLKEGQSCISQASHPGGEHYLWHTGNAYALTSVQEALAQ